LVELGTESYARRVDRTRIRDFWLRILTLNTERFLEHRDEDQSTRWLDVPYSEVSRQSFETVSRIYEALDIPATDATVEIVARWEREHPQHAGGEFSYRLEDYGLTESDVEREFADYISRFGTYF
jgi:hypothetical protein